jgi:hypothetical protein
VPVTEQYKREPSFVHYSDSASYFVGDAMELPESLDADFCCKGSVVLPVDSPQMDSPADCQVYKLLQRQPLYTNDHISNQIVPQNIEKHFCCLSFDRGGILSNEFNHPNFAGYDDIIHCDIL